MILLISCVFLLSSCNSIKKDANLPIGDYLMEESEEIIKPVVSLQGDNKFVFNYSPLSSYYNHGCYEVDGDNLILKTEDGMYKYVFQIGDNTLSFNEKLSSEISSYAESAGATFTKNVIDGSIFVLDKK